MEKKFKRMSGQKKKSERLIHKTNQVLYMQWQLSDQIQTGRGVSEKKFYSD